jgi:hypothetical protein
MKFSLKLLQIGVLIPTLALVSCNQRSEEGRLSIHQSTVFRLRDDNGSSLDLKNGQWKVSLFRWVNGDPEITFARDKEEVKFSLPKSCIRSSEEILCPSSENKLGYDVHAYRSVKELKTWIASGKDSCTYSGYCNGWDYNKGKYRYGFHYNCSGSRTADFQYTELSINYKIDFSEAKGLERTPVATFESTAQRDVRSAFIRATGNCH